METASIYGGALPRLNEVLDYLQQQIELLRADITAGSEYDPVEHCLGRIKSEESMREKCRRKGLPETAESALEKIHDAVGVRVVCSFVNDVYVVRDRLASLERVQVVEEKDYIRRAKPNGYRSLHLILLVDGTTYAEIQIRTISQDSWAALEHHLKYKKQIDEAAQELIVAELKRCADELASTDLSMQTIRDMISSLS